MFRKAYRHLQTPVHIAPLVIFRMTIGAMMVFSTLRFMMLGWIEDHYINPVFHFSYYAFGWIHPLPVVWMYGLHVLMILASAGVMLGFYFRASAILLFLSFTYTELIDLTYYLNHYYFVTLVLFMLIFTPAHRYFSFDAQRNPGSQTKYIPRFWIVSFQLLLAIVYTYAGLAKINYEWLLQALPLKIWLGAQDKMPIIGKMFTWPITPYIFSWIGMVYDCTIVWWLLHSRTRPWAYAAVIAFHILTGILFQIGVFPVVMIGATLIFFSETWHVNILERLKIFVTKFSREGEAASHGNQAICKPVSRLHICVFILFFLFQLCFPWRYIVYPGNVFWTEEGYRFSWRVMLMEKAGTATFYVKDAITRKEGMVINSEFLNSHQEKQMAMQPDMILQFAHFLKEHYQRKGMNDPQVRAEVFVTLNARPSQLLIDPKVNLTEYSDGWKHKPWILPSPK